MVGFAISLALIAVAVRLSRRGAFSQEVESQSAREVREESEKPASVRVDTVKPKLGGIERTIQQPASVEAFETVDLFAMVSGYLKCQGVDIGSRIKQGEVLAEINVPRDAKVVDEAASLVEQARAQIAQAEAMVKVAEAQRDAAEAAANQSESDVHRLVSARELADKQYARVYSLAERNAVDKRLVDEQRNVLDTAVAAERTAELAVLTAKAQVYSAKATVEKARADALESRASLGVAEARHGKAKINLVYAKIVAPFDGVVTHRSFHPGALIHSALEGGKVPLLTVKRTDLMRVVVLVPDRDVVMAQVGRSAEVTVDALGGQSFRGTLARIGQAENAERLMRVEIDLPNPKALLRDGMYGKAKILLDSGVKNLTLPPACVSEHRGRSGGILYVVDKGIVRRTEVKLGADNGVLVEILEGLAPNASVVVHADSPLADGLQVVEDDPAAPAA
jgi:HlyD family secretion protein